MAVSHTVIDPFAPNTCSDTPAFAIHDDGFTSGSGRRRDVTGVIAVKLPSRSLSDVPLRQSTNQSTSTFWSGEAWTLIQSRAGRLMFPAPVKQYASWPLAEQCPMSYTWAGLAAGTTRVVAASSEANTLEITGVILARDGLHVGRKLAAKNFRDGTGTQVHRETDCPKCHGVGYYPSPEGGHYRETAYYWAHMYDLRCNCPAARGHSAQMMGNLHPQALVRHDGLVAWADEGMVTDLQQLWAAGIRTVASCQGGDEPRHAPRHVVLPLVNLVDAWELLPWARAAVRMEHVPDLVDLMEHACCCRCFEEGG